MNEWIIRGGIFIVAFILGYAWNFIFGIRI